MKVVWTPESSVRLREIEAFIALDQLERGRKFVARLIESGESLASLHLRGRIVPELSDPEIREIIVDRYRIVYRCGLDRIVILTVFEGHRTLQPGEIL